PGQIWIHTFYLVLSTITHRLTLLGKRVSMIILLPGPPTSTLFPYTTLFRSKPAKRSAKVSMCCFTNRVVGTSMTTCLPSCTALRSEEHTSELQSRENLVCRLLLEKKNLSVINVITGAPTTTPIA